MVSSGEAWGDQVMRFRRFCVLATNLDEIPRCDALVNALLVLVLFPAVQTQLSVHARSVWSDHLMQTVQSKRNRSSQPFVHSGEASVAVKGSTPVHRQLSACAGRACTDPNRGQSSSQTLLFQANLAAKHLFSLRLCRCWDCLSARLSRLPLRGVCFRTPLLLRSICMSVGELFLPVRLTLDLSIMSSRDMPSFTAFSAMLAVTIAGLSALGWLAAEHISGCLTWGAGMATEIAEGWVRLRR